MDKADRARVAELNDEELLSLMPAAFVRGLAPVLPAATLLRLIQVLPGASVKVPAKPNSENRLARALSLDEFAALCRQAKGCTLEIPLGWSLKVGLRHREIARLAAQGHSRREIAERMGITQRQVRRVLNRHLPDPQGFGPQRLQDANTRANAQRTEIPTTSLRETTRENERLWTPERDH